MSKEDDKTVIHFRQAIFDSVQQPNDPEGGWTRP
jgi:hypothetical protein